MYFQQLKEKALLQIKYLRSGDENAVKQINAISDYQINLMMPRIFVPGHPDNCIIAIEIAFESLCTNLEELGVMNPKKLSVFEFYSKIRYFKDKKKPR